LHPLLWNSSLPLQPSLYRSRPIRKAAYTLFLAAALIVIGLPALAESLPGPFTAEVVRVIDGDTFEGRIRVWLGMDVTVHIRIEGMDAPELRGHCPGERAAAELARDHLIRLLGARQVLLTHVRPDKYGGRVDAAIHLPNGDDISAAMISAGHALPSKHSRVRRC
jgi:micrococcal nuclease